MTHRHPFRTALALLIAALAVPSVARAADLSIQSIDAIPIRGSWIAKWREDLSVAKQKMPETHLRIDHTTSWSDLEAAIDELSQRIPELTHQEAIVELAEIVARIGDGHTRLTLPFDPASGFSSGHTGTAEATLPGAPFHHYPVRFFLYEDGLTVEKIANEHAALLGARVVRIGSMSTDEAIAAVEPTIHRDNAMQVRQNLPATLVIPELLSARGVIERIGPLTLDLETPSGKPATLTLQPVPLGEAVSWAPTPQDRVPLFRRHPDQRYRFEYFDETRTVYFRYRMVQNEEDGESLPHFAQRMFSFIDDNAVKRLIIDLRGNDGGNNWLNAPLERGIFRAESLWRPGGIVAIADRMTFSAAMNFANFLTGATPAVLLGEASGGRPNHYGDARKLQLPNTGLTVRLSSVYHQDAGASDEREQIDPHIRLPLTAADIREGRDPVLEEILSWSAPGTLTGSWAGPATMRLYTTQVSLRLHQSEAGWSGDFDAPGWFPPTAISNARQLGDEILFDLELETTTIRIRARALGERLVGMLDYQGQWYPFLVSRATAAP